MVKGAFDFLRRGEVDLGLVEEYLIANGYKAEELRQPYRHVVGKVSRDDKSYFFKMASRAELSVYIENEYKWASLVHREKLAEKWALAIPKVYILDKMGDMSWLMMEYIDGVDAGEDPDLLESTIRPVAEVITDIILMKAIEGLPLDNNQPNKNLKARVEERIDAYLEIIDNDFVDEKIVRFLYRNIDLIENAPIRGDLGIDNIRKDTSGKLWLLDSEFASFDSIKFYDAAYYYFRLGVNGNRVDLADKFLGEFRAVCRMTSADEKLLCWNFFYRLLGAYREVMDVPDLYGGVEGLKVLLLEKYKRTLK